MDAFSSWKLRVFVYAQVGRLDRIGVFCGIVGEYNFGSTEDPLGVIFEASVFMFDFSDRTTLVDASLLLSASA
jgi:hypothetical protein